MSDRHDAFSNARVGGGLNYDLRNGWQLAASLDYRLRYYDEDENE